jgi:hypothetical protein
VAGWCPYPHPRDSSSGAISVWLGVKKRANHSLLDFFFFTGKQKLRNKKKTAIKNKENKKMQTRLKVSSPPVDAIY